MEIKFNTTEEALKNIVDKIHNNKNPQRQDFEDLVDTAQKCSVFNDNARYLKFLLPFKNNYAENLTQRNLNGLPWSEELAEQMANLLVELFTKIKPFNMFYSYCIEKKENGYYVAFDIEDSEKAGKRLQYFGYGKTIIKGLRANGVEITPEEWLERFPIDYFTAAMNRDSSDYTLVSDLAVTRMMLVDKEPEEGLKNLSKEERVMLSEVIFFNPSNYNFVGLIAGRDIDFNKFPTGYISKWNPKEKFIEVPRFEYLDVVKDRKKRGVRTQEELEVLKNEFLNSF